MSSNRITTESEIKAKYGVSNISDIPENQFPTLLDVFEQVAPQLAMMIINNLPKFVEYIKHSSDNKAKCRLAEINAKTDILQARQETTREMLKSDIDPKDKAKLYAEDTEQFYKAIDNISHPNVSENICKIVGKELLDIADTILY